jgi:hypothetical protein
MPAKRKKKLNATEVEQIAQEAYSYVGAHVTPSFTPWDMQDANTKEIWRQVANWYNLKLWEQSQSNT